MMAFSVITFGLRDEMEVHQNANVCKQGQWVGLCHCKRSHMVSLNLAIVHKLLTIITRFFVTFIIPVSLKMYVLRLFLSR